MNETLTWADLQDAGNAQAQLVLLAIARSADWETGEGYPDLKTIADRAKCSPRTAWTYVKKLADDGLITRVPRKRYDGGRASDLITLAGYCDWRRALREGGVVARPRALKKYAEQATESAEEPPSQDLHGGSVKPVDEGAEFASPPTQACLRAPHASMFATPKNVNLTSNTNFSASARALDEKRAWTASRPQGQWVLTPVDVSWGHWIEWLTDHDRRDLAVAAQEAQQMVVVGSKFPKPGGQFPRIDHTAAIAARKIGGRT